MSTLRVNTIQDTAGSGSPAINGLARAWVNFNGTGTVAIRAALNVSSITDNGTGDYRINFTTALADSNYSTVASHHVSGTGTGALQTVNDTNYNSTGFQLIFRNTGGSNVDCDFVHAASFR